MKRLKTSEIKEIIQSGHLNFLIGSGCSQPYLSTVSNIETEMNDKKTQEKAQKEYYQIIRKSLAVLKESRETDSSETKKLKNTKQNYEKFIYLLVTSLSRRRLQIVNRQANIFTTNFDMFLENSCELLGVPYNDGFTGQINRLFNASNFSQILKYKSLQFDNTSDIPLINIIKLHGSVSWMTDNKEKSIHYSDGAHIPLKLDEKSGQDFSKGYEKIAVVNPDAKKHFETVLDTNYAAMLRKFTLELEKENSVLVIIGFSLDDKHIRELLYGVMKTNPTLVVIFYSYSKYDEAQDSLEEKKNANFYVISPESNDEAHKQAFDRSTDNFFSVINNSNNKKSRDEGE